MPPSAPRFAPTLRSSSSNPPRAAEKHTREPTMPARSQLRKASNRLLILTHTPRPVRFSPTGQRAAVRRVDIRTIDSVIAQIAAAYHVALGLPANTASWVRQQGEEGYALLAIKVASLVRLHPMISAALAQRHAHVICDEHQDSSGDQHAIVMTLLRQGARVRLFGDPMQKIFRDKAPVAGASPPCDWDKLKTDAHAFEELDFPTPLVFRLRGTRSMDACGAECAGVGAAR